MSPHPSVTKARHALRAVLGQLPARTPVLLGVSGGSDSLALAITAAFLAPKLAIDVHTVTVDHGVRPESADEAQAVVQQLAALGLKSASVKVKVAEGGDGPEGEARKARYQALADYAKDIGATVVVLGHTLGDQAETVLLGLGRGAGARSLRGMAQISEFPDEPTLQIARPFLGMNRAELRTVCAEYGQRWVDDPSNAIDGPWRTRTGEPLRRSMIRHRVIPVLEEALGSGVVESLARTARMLGEDEEVLSALAAQALDEARIGGAPLTVNCATLAAYPTAIRRRALRLAMLDAGVRGGELVYWHVAAVDKLVTTRDNKLGIDLPGARAWRENNTVQFWERP